MALGGEIERLYILFDADGRPYVKGLRALEMATHTSGGRMVSAWSKYGGASGKAVAAGLAVGTVALAAFGALVVKTGVKFEELEHTIRKGTGATGKALEGLTDSAKKVYAVVEQSSADVATVVADLNTRLGATGEHLEKLAKQMIDLSDVSGEVPAALVAATTRAFGDWSIATEKQSEALDWMWKVSQSTGIGVTQLSQKVVQAGAPLRELGFDFETATTMMGQFEREGVNAEAILGSLKIGLARMASEGFTNAEDALAELMRRIKEAPEGLDAVSMAMEIFGSRAAADFTLAVREERFEFDELLNSLRSSPETIAAAESATETLGDKWKTTLHKMELQLEPLGTRVLEYLNSAFDQMSETAEKEGWGVAVGQIVGDAIGEAAKFAMAEAGPFLIEVGWRFATGAVEGTARGTLQMLGLDPYGDYSTDLERWENYIREQMREYTAYGSVEGFRLAMGDLNNAIQTEGLLEGLYLGRPKTADEMMELAR
ncbi:MAG: phage tail tape measure protein, partial [Thermoleophilia bacterium]|nr:phage tail tape measure protein [Thermoleophilia bacterium]